MRGTTANLITAVAGADGAEPFPWQRALAEGPWPEVLRVPTGLGKTGGVLAAWLSKRLAQDPETPRRLVWCLPMRALVEQVHSVAEHMAAAAVPVFNAQGLEAPRVHRLMGGAVDEAWERFPERPAIIVGTQDMLLSRALLRGYGMGRYRWAVPFALLHSDALWVFDEVQVMGPAVATSAQLEGLRRAFGTARPSRSLWMSATLQPEWLRTVDLPDALRMLEPGPDDLATETVQRRLSAPKALARAASMPTSAKTKDVAAYTDALATEIADAHRPGTLTLAVVNTVARAQALYTALTKRTEAPRALVHSRFRAPDRRAAEDALTAPLPETGRIVVATQAVEAGIDVSAATLVTELAPWASIVQRCGRCNRQGEHADGRVLWVDLPDALTAPYDADALAEARTRLEDLTSAAPTDLPPVETPPPLTAVLRRKDLRDLFDTEPDLGGLDVDVAPYIRDADDSDVRLFWRDLSQSPAPEQPEAEPDELCAAPVAAAARLIERTDGAAFAWDGLDRRWRRLRKADLRPGMVVMVDAAVGGYVPTVGFSDGARKPVPPLPPTTAAPPAMDADPRSVQPRAVALADHLRHAEAEATALAATLALPEEEAAILRQAALWHDVGKAHPVFQTAVGDGEVPLAKSQGPMRRYARPCFRHELASALALLAHAPAGPETDLAAYLAAAHHGKVRLTLRALPGEVAPDDPAAPFARGIHDGDTLPPLTVGTRDLPETALSLDIMRLGEGSWAARNQALLDRLGPFRLAWLEALVRIADWRASANEQQGAQKDHTP